MLVKAEFAKLVKINRILVSYFVCLFSFLSVSVFIMFIMLFCTFSVIIFASSRKCNNIILSGSKAARSGERN